MPNTIYLNLPLFILGLVIIVKGSGIFLDSAVWMARASGISQVIIGATVVSFCTTLPELVSSCTAAFKGAPDMAIGNAVGSVICNTGLILGMVLCFTIARIRSEVFLIKGTFMLGSLLIGLLVLWPLPGQQAFVIERSEGLILLILLLIFLVVNYYESLHNVNEAAAVADLAPATVAHRRRELIKRLGLFAAGAGATAVGAYLLIEFGQRLARNMHMSEAVISLLFVALGTSLPELFTAISAVRKKAENISVGNIFGANVLNMALVTGTSAVITPLTPHDHYLASFDIPVALVICTVVFLIGLKRGRVGRGTGITLLTFYVLYLLSMAIMGRIGDGVA